MSIFNNILGVVSIKISSSYIERFLNECTQLKIKILSTKYLGLGEILIQINLVDLNNVKKVLKDSRYSYKIVKKQGLSFEFHKKRKRVGLLFGLFIALIFYQQISSEIVAIEINGTQNKFEIYSILAEKGVVIGEKIENIDTRTLPRVIVHENSEILWCAFNVKGNTLTVEIKEQTSLPQVVDKTLASDIIAEKSGIIDSIDVKYGEKIVDAGQTFNQGDVLVSADIVHFDYKEDPKTTLVQSIANIYARISYNFERILPQNMSEKIYTGKEKTSYSIIFQKNSYNLFKNSGNDYAFCDKIVETKEFYLSPYIKFPLSLQIEKYIEYEKNPVILEDSSDILVKNAKTNVINNINGAVLSENFAKTSNSDFLRISYRCETLEKIGINIQR